MGQSLDGETEARGPPCERQLTPLPGHQRCPGPCVEQAWPPAPTCPATPAESWKGFSVVSLLAGQGTVLAAGRHRPAFAPCLKRPHFPPLPTASGQAPHPQLPASAGCSQRADVSASCQPAPSRPAKTFRNAAGAGADRPGRLWSGCGPRGPPEEGGSAQLWVSLTWVQILTPAVYQLGDPEQPL